MALTVRKRGSRYKITTASGKVPKSVRGKGFRSKKHAEVVAKAKGK